MSPLLMAVLVLGAAGGLLKLYWSKGRRRLVSVTAEVYKSGAFPARRIAAVVQRHGIRSVVDLRRPCQRVEAERATLQALGVTHHNLPSAKDPSPAAIAAFVELASRVETPVLIHCNHGAGRAPLFTALYLVSREGWEPERAKRAANWPAGGDHRRITRSPDGAEYLVHLAPRVQRSRHHRLMAAIAVLLACVWLGGSIERHAVFEGLALMVAGLAWHFWCGGFIRPGLDRMPTGPFRVFSHAHYLGTLAFLVGASITLPLPWWVRVALVAVFLAGSLMGVRHDDVKLRRRLGASEPGWLHSVVPSPTGAYRALRDDVRSACSYFSWSRARADGSWVAIRFAALAFLCLWARLEWEASAPTPARRPADNLSVDLLLIGFAVAAGYVLWRSSRSLPEAAAAPPVPPR